jgi:hypothetical protein
MVSAVIIVEPSRSFVVGKPAVANARVMKGSA